MTHFKEQVVEIAQPWNSLSRFRAERRQGSGIRPGQPVFYAGAGGFVNDKALWSGESGCGLRYDLNRENLPFQDSPEGKMKTIIWGILTAAVTLYIFSLYLFAKLCFDAGSACMLGASVLFLLAAAVMIAGRSRRKKREKEETASQREFP